LDHSQLKGLVAKTLLITPSGALSPGPLSLTAIVAGSTLGSLGGVYVALGHMAFELPYVAVLWLASQKVKPLIERFEKPLATITAAFIAFFAYLTGMAALRGFEASGYAPVATPIEAFLAGVALTAFNPYFLVWWLSAGYPLVTGASEGGGKALLVMYASHVWMDYAWLALLAATGGLASAHQAAYRLLMAAIALVLALFAADMLARAWLRRKILPI
jgi:threonine/homoserine/homoserine lactone efflux protein